MFAPASFTLDPVLPSQATNPAPPRVTKAQLYRDIKVFKAVDEYAIKIAKKNYSTFRDLIWNLTYKKKFNELEKARVIFRWMTARDLQTIAFEESNAGTPEQLLTAFKAGKTTYARIFECLARHAGLPCITLSGWAKGVDYRPGVPITSRPINHSWNAVRLDGDWQLVDCHWATRFLQSERNVPENLVYEYDDFYFIPPPAQLGYTHRPEDSAWQLVPAPPGISAELFEDYPLVKSYFFTTGMLFLPENNHGVIRTKNGVVALSIGFTGRTAFTFKLGYGDGMAETVGGHELSRCVIQETRDDRVVFYVRLLDKGDFYLIVFANVVNDQVSSSENIFKAVCEYKIECPDPAPDSVGLFPGCSDASWGPDTFVNQFGLTPVNRAAILLAPDGHAEVSFDRKGDVRVYARLVRDGVEDTKLKQAVSVKNDGDKTTVVVNLPAEGEYGLEVFANEPKKDGDMFTHVCQYLCAFTNKSPSDAYGHVSTDAPLSQASHRGDVAVDAPEPLYRGFVDTDDVEDIVDATEYIKAYPFGRSSKPKKRLSMQQSLDPEEEYTPHAAAVYRADIDVQPPESFQMQAIHEETSPVPEAPSGATKLFIDTSVFHNVDTHAMEVSKLEHASFRDILWHLIYARDITNELDKARAIFLWLCSKDLSKLNFSSVEKGSPEEILMNLQRGLTTYARVYETLCSYAGLLCKTLTGYAKGAEYKPGMKFSGTQGQHSWNAVKVNGTWQLVDCHWAARRVVGKKVEMTSDNVRYELDEYYFMPAPAQLIFTHFPEDPSWQLLDPILASVEEFQNLVPVKPAFFKYGLELDSHTDATIHTAGDDITIQIRCPAKMAKSLRFTFNLTYEDGREDHKGTKLNRFAMQELVGTVAYLTVRLPEKGAYQMVIYAKDLDHQTKEGVYGGVCEYKLINTVDPPKPNPFPPCVHTTWGPGDSAPKFDLTPRQGGAIVTTTNGVAEVKFGLSCRLRFVAKLKSNDRDDKSLAPYVIYRVVNEEVIFRVLAPAEGEFGLEIYANNPALGGQALQHAYQYLVISRDPVAPDLEPFPTLTSGYLGPQPSFEAFGLAVDGNPDPYQQVDLQGQGPLQLSFRLSRALRITSQLLYASGGQNQDCSEYILQQSTSKGVTFIVSPPRTGQFKFQIFATLASETGDSLPGVYNYLLQCRSTVDAPAPFPKQFGPWKEGCHLEGPLQGRLQTTDSHAFFKMDVPRASAVAVVIGQEWTQLKQSGTSWQGEVPVGKHADKEHKATVCGNFGATATSFSTLLEYSM